MAVIGTDNFKGMTDAPAYNLEPGWLRELGNMRVRPGGYLEMRGGMTRLKPNGGTAVDPVSSAGSGYLGAIDNASPVGYVRVYNAAGNTWKYPVDQNFRAYGPNLAYISYYEPLTGVGDYVCFGSDTPFSSVTMTVVQGGGALTYAYEYSITDGAPPIWSALTLTDTPNLNPVIVGPNYYLQTTMSWQLPTVTPWVPVTIGDSTAGFTYKYWVRIRVTGGAGAVLFGEENVHADWSGINDLIVAAGNPYTGAKNAKLYLYSNNVATGSWYDMNTSVVPTATLLSGNAARHRMASYRGVVYAVNGNDDKRWDGSNLDNTGLPAPTQTFTIANGGVGPGTWTGTGAALQFRYAFTYGYGSQQVAVERELAGPPRLLGPNGSYTYTPTLLGESPPCKQSSVAYPAGGDRITIPDANQVNISLAAQPPSGVDVIYVYRTEDLTNVPTSAVDSMPFYFVASWLKNANIWQPAPTVIADQRIAFVSPSKELDQEDTTPPPRCKLVWIHKNRAFRANSDRYPARVWWSRAYEPDAFNTDLDFEDFSTTQGGRVTAGCEFMNQSVVFTEDQMYGISDVDVDQFQSYPIAPGIGCIATDSLVVSDGYMIWMSRDGIYLWNGDELPQKISTPMDNTFSRMSSATHGDSRATIHNNQYELWVVAKGGLSSTDGYRFDLITGTWSTVGYSAPPLAVPFATVTAPLGTVDAGIRHPLIAAMPRPSSSDLQIYFGEYSTTDDGAVISVTVDVHFGPGGFQLIKPDRVAFYYDALDGWSATPQVSIPTASISTVGTGFNIGDILTDSPDVGNEFSIVQGVFKIRGSGAQGVVVRFNQDSIAGGTIWGQRLLAAYLEGQTDSVKRP